MARNAPLRWASLVFVGLTLVTSCGAGIATMAQAPGGEANIDSWDSSLLAAVIGLVVPVMFLVGLTVNDRGWWGRRAHVVLPLVSSVVPVLFVVWVVNHGAATGEGHHETLAVGRQELVEDIRAGIAASGAGGVTFDERESAPCVNDFGRDRGAYSTTIHGFVEPSLTVEQFTLIVQHLRSRRWSVDVSRRRESLLAGDGREVRWDSESFRAEKRGYRIAYSDLRTADGFTARTACLRK